MHLVHVLGIATPIEIELQVYTDIGNQLQDERRGGWIEFQDTYGTAYRVRPSAIIGFSR